MTKKILIVLFFVVIAFIVFTIIVITGFNHIKNNPMDIVAKKYIYNSTSISDKYGAVISVGRNVINETINLDDHKIKAPYTVTTNSYRLIVYVEMEENNNEWTALSLEIKEVIHNDA